MGPSIRDISLFFQFLEPLSVPVMKEMIVDFDPFLAGKWPQGIKAKLDILIFSISIYLILCCLKIQLLDHVASFDIGDLRRG